MAAGFVSGVSVLTRRRNGCSGTLRSRPAAASRRSVLRANLASSTERKAYTSEDNWYNMTKSVGIWEGNVTSYDIDGKETKRQGNSLYIFPEDIGEREDGKPGPRTVWAQLHLEHARKASEVMFHHQDMLAKGRTFGPRGEMCSAGMHATKLTGAYFEMILPGYDDSGRYFGRARCVFTAYRDTGVFSEYTIFRERAAKEELPRWFSEVPDKRQASPEIKNTDHPWLDQPEEPDDWFRKAFEGSWKGEITKIHVKEREQETIAYDLDGEVNGDDARLSYNFSTGDKETHSGRFTAPNKVEFEGTYVQKDLGKGVSVLHPHAIPDDNTFLVQLSWKLGNTRRQMTRKYEKGQYIWSAFDVVRRQ
mmetsp:Transcript_9651/g.29293  ORF Transcript_9651/g.29293 Transcript_9651/m.29293 type:complete len:363 (+) Transcript_9651:77-1165(+)